MTEQYILGNTTKMKPAESSRGKETNSATQNSKQSIMLRSTKKKMLLRLNKTDSELRRTCLCVYYNFVISTSSTQPSRVARLNILYVSISITLFEYTNHATQQCSMPPK